jgi:hypothetical protein
VFALKTLRSLAPYAASLCGMTACQLSAGKVDRKAIEAPQTVAAVLAVKREDVLGDLWIREVPGGTVNHATFFGMSGVVSSGTASLIQRSISSKERSAATARS